MSDPHFKILPPSVRVSGPLLAVLVLANCAPDLGPLPQPKPQSAYATQKSFAAPNAQWPASNWWTAYHDPELDALITDGLSGAPDIKIAMARLRQAEAAVQQSGAALMPELSANGSASEVRQSLNQGFPNQFKAFLPHGWHDRGQVSGNLDYSLDLFGRNRAAFIAATSEAEAARVDMAEARLTLSTAIAIAYANLGRLAADRAAAADALSDRRQSAELVRQRHAQQLENEGEVFQALSRTAAAEAELDRIDGQIALARNQLAALIGKGPDRGLSIKLPTAAKLRPFGVPKSLSVDLIGRRPDIVAARLRASAAASRIDVARAAYYPNIDLSGYFGLQAIGLGDLVSPSSEIGKIGPAISLPIFDVGRIEGAYRGARAEYDEAVANYDKTLTTALHEVADALANQRELKKERGHARTAFKESENAYRIAKLRYSGGLSSYLDVLTAEDTMVQQRRAVSDLDARAFTQDIQLIRALGGGFQSSAMDGAQTAKE